MVIVQKWDHLKALLHDMPGAVLAYSGGVDSSLLLRAAAEVMGANLIAVTAVSETYPEGELRAAQEIARSLGVTHRIVHTEELASEDFARNPPDRCYHCKKELFERLRRLAADEGVSFIMDGSNADDLRDHRPGRKAAAEFSVRSPLLEAGFTKAEVRERARALGLIVWDKPSFACLSSRIPYGTRITPELIRTVGAAEEQLRAFGFGQARVRHHGDIARIEVMPEDFAKLLHGDIASKIAARFRELGYIYVCLDIEGYRTGSMNEGMKIRSQESGVRRHELAL
jgi:uncharacterized protein